MRVHLIDEDPRDAALGKALVLFDNAQLPPAHWPEPSAALSGGEIQPAKRDQLKPDFLDLHNHLFTQDEPNINYYTAERIGSEKSKLRPSY
jgi:hypothetical protein